MFLTLVKRGARALVLLWAATTSANAGVIYDFTITSLTDNNSGQTSSSTPFIGGSGTGTTGYNDICDFSLLHDAGAFVKTSWHLGTIHRIKGMAKELPCRRLELQRLNSWGRRCSQILPHWVRIS